MIIPNNDVATISAAINALEDRIIKLESQTIFIEKDEAPKTHRKNRKEGNDNQQQQRDRHQSSNSQT